MQIFKAVSICQYNFPLNLKTVLRMTSPGFLLYRPLLAEEGSEEGPGVLDAAPQRRLAVLAVAAQLCSCSPPINLKRNMGAVIATTRSLFINLGKQVEKGG